MNIFILNENPVIAAQEQCDKHVVKMILESAQMLSTCHRMLDGSETRKPSKSGKTMSKYWVLPDNNKESVMYKAVHMNHPCTVWTRESHENYNWHYEHFVALCEEYTYRYGRVHATDAKLRTMLKELPTNIPMIDQTQFKLAMEHEPQCKLPCPIESYQRYYETKQVNFKMAWTKRQQPEWFNAYV